MMVDRAAGITIAAIRGRIRARMLGNLGKLCK